VPHCQNSFQHVYEHKQHGSVIKKNVKLAAMEHMHHM
jgi:hypothetical protein